MTGRWAVPGAAGVLALLWFAAPLAAQVPPVDEQIAGAVLPLPPSQREGATVMGYRVEGELTTLRRGTGGMICLADEPGNDQYHVACYHESLEPFMARGRELRAKGIDDIERERIRGEEAAAGTLALPEAPAAFHSLTGPVSGWDPAARTLQGGRALHTVYIPWATPEQTGLSTEPGAPAQPWLMFPGTHRAHIMIIPLPAGSGR